MINVIVLDMIETTWENLFPQIFEQITSSDGREMRNETK